MITGYTNCPFCGKTLGPLSSTIIYCDHEIFSYEINMNEYGARECFKYLMNNTICYFYRNIDRENDDVDMCLNSSKLDPKLNIKNIIDAHDKVPNIAMELCSIIHFRSDNHQDALPYYEIMKSGDIKKLLLLL